MADQLQLAGIRRFRRCVLTWYGSCGRSFPWRSDDEPLFRLVVSELLLQRTRATTVARFYRHFFSTYSSWTDLANTDLETIAQDLKPIGMWRQKSSRLRDLAVAVEKLGGNLPKGAENLERLPGLGQYMVNAILLLTGQEAAPLIDVNMARVLERYFGPRKLADLRYDKGLQELAWEISAGDNPKKVNWAILDLAALICRQKNPYCASCPVQTGCREYRRTLSNS